MKLKWSLFTLCLMFSGAVMAESVPTDPAAVPASKTRTHKKKKRASSKTKAPAKGAKAAAAATPAEPVAEPAQAEAKVDTFQSWLEGIKKRLGKSDSHSNKLVSVAAVRGDEVSDSAPLYWKGRKAEQRAVPPEQKDFEAAIDVALTGDKVAAKERLQSFLLAYPKSSFAPDAQETLNRLEAN